MKTITILKEQFNHKQKTCKTLTRHAKLLQAFKTQQQRAIYSSKEVNFRYGSISDSEKTETVIMINFKHFKIL